MKFYLSLLLLCACSCTALYAQKENNIWTFGHNGGLDFNSGAPVWLSSSIRSMEGAASVSDHDGNLLFYSNGNDVWDANGNVMPNGGGLQGNGSTNPDYPCSSSQGVAIVRFVSDTQRYYVFVLDAAEDVIYNGIPGYLRYSVVDMSLNGGLGDVVPGQKNIVLDSMIGEQMCVAGGGGCYYWLLTHSNTAPLYKAFKIDASGIQPPVLSPGVFNNFMPGEMKISPDETRLALTIHVTLDTIPNNTAGVELGTFDKSTGMISNVIVIDTGIAHDKYSLSFSPDNSKLYSGNYPSPLVQYDITAYPNAAAITGSQVTIYTGEIAGMRIGPDNKIYIAPGYTNGSGAIARINQPDMPGLACNFDANAIILPSSAFFPPFYTLAGQNLGNPVVINAGNADTLSDRQDMALCPGAQITIPVPEGYENYRWDNGSTDSVRNVNTPGWYWVTGKNGCGAMIDSFNVYLVEPMAGIIERDTELCLGTTIMLHAVARPVSSYQWSTGATTDSILVTEPGQYSVTATNACGSYSDSVDISFMECQCRPFVPNAFSPNGDGINDLFRPRISCPVTRYNFSVYNRYGQRLFFSTDPGAGWDGTFHHDPVDGGTYFYYLQFTSRYEGTVGRKGDIVLVR